MSAWSVGATRSRALLSARKPDAGEFVSRVIRWIPGDIVVMYAAAIQWVTPEPADPSMNLLLVFMAAAGVMVILGAFATRTVERFDWIKAVLAVFAFGIWSLSVPRSGWQQLAEVADNPGLVTAASALGGVMFGLIADGIERRFS
jgi:NADH:ubiquinone oxidoreductase subunit 6 (subunit J)